MSQIDEMMKLHQEALVELAGSMARTVRELIDETRDDFTNEVSALSKAIAEARQIADRTSALDLPSVQVQIRALENRLAVAEAAASAGPPTAQIRRARAIRALVAAEAGAWARLAPR